MSTIKSSAENLTLNADGSGNDIIFQSNGSNVATLDQAGTLTATTFTGAATDATKLPLAGGTITGNLLVETTSAAGAVIRSKGSYADGYRHGFEAVNGHTGGETWSMFSTNNSDGTFAGGSLVFSPTISSSANAGTSKLLITSAGEVTMPSQPAFLVNPSAQQSNYAEGSDVTVVFGTERFDQGSDFASNTFTAPVTGKYQLSVALRIEAVDTAPAYYQIKIVTSNRTFESTYAPKFASDPDYFTFTQSALADMDSGDTAHIAIHQHSGGTAQSDIAATSWFSGFLAC